jgi:exoribonuclease R
MKTVESIRPSLSFPLEIQPSREDRRETHRVFSIDPPHSLDIDDAISIQKDPTNPFIITLSIYIADVVATLEQGNLWYLVNEQPATIYLPEKKRPMLPANLSDDLCSLLENEDRYAFVLDLTYDTQTNPPTLQSQSFHQTIIRVQKNEVYEDPDLLPNPDYQTLVTLVNLQVPTSNLQVPTVNLQVPTVNLQVPTDNLQVPTIMDSHEVVEQTMLIINHHAATVLKSCKTGIFRTVQSSKSSSSVQQDMSQSLSQGLPEDVQQYIKLWHSHNAGVYTVFEEGKSTHHDLLGLDAYLHISSPIRRAVDISNLVALYKVHGWHISQEAVQFYEKIENQIAQVNEKMRSIKQVQSRATLLHTLTHQPNLLDPTYTAYLLETDEENGVHWFYIPAHSFVCYIKMGTYAYHTPYQVKLYLFEDQNNSHKKIRIQIQDQPRIQDQTKII